MVLRYWKCLASSRAESIEASKQRRGTDRAGGGPHRDSSISDFFPRDSEPVVSLQDYRFASHQRVYFIDERLRASTLTIG